MDHHVSFFHLSWAASGQNCFGAVETPPQPVVSQDRHGNPETLPVVLDLFLRLVVLAVEFFGERVQIDFVSSTGTCIISNLG